MGLSFAACEPQLIDGPDAYATVDEATLAEAITYTQYADKELTQPDPAGNFVKYNSSVGVVQVFSMTGASPLVTGAGGTFKLPVKRGHVGNISMKFRLPNADGTFTTATKEFTCTPPSELTREQILLTGDYSKKVWQWGPAYYDGEDYYAPWTMAGYTSDAGAQYVEPDVVVNYWWSPEDLNTLGKGEGDGDLASYMVLTEDGEVASYLPDGTLVRKGGFELKNYDPTRADGWSLGKFVTSEPAILCPWEADEGQGVTEFDVMYLTPQNLTLAYTAPNAADWDTSMTIWRFVSGTPDQYTLEGKWTYGVELNSRYSFVYGGAPKEGEGFDYNVLTGDLPGFSWGYAPSRLAEKSELYAERGQVFGDAAEGAYMEFKEDWVTTYSPAGEKVREATWSIQMNDPTVNGRRGDNGIELGTLTTTGPGLLFPWTYQTPGVPVTEYKILYYDSNNIVLYKEGPEDPEFDNMTMWVFSRVKE